RVHRWSLSVAGSRARATSAVSTIYPFQLLPFGVHVNGLRYPALSGLDPLCRLDPLDVCLLMTGPQRPLQDGAQLEWPHASSPLQVPLDRPTQTLPFAQPG